MVRYFKIQQFAYHRFDILDARVAKLDDFSTMHTYRMVVLFEAVGLFVLREVFSELVFADQIAVDQEVKRVVNRGATDAVVLVFHVDIQRLGIEMVAATVYFFQNGVTFGRFPKAADFEVLAENGGHLFDDVGVVVR